MNGIGARRNADHLARAGLELRGRRRWSATDLDEFKAALDGLVEESALRIRGDESVEEGCWYVDVLVDGAVFELDFEDLVGCGVADGSEARRRHGDAIHRCIMPALSALLR